MSKAIWKPTTLLGPMPPALVSCAAEDKPNVLTVAWTGIVNTHPPMTYVSIRPSRYSHQLIVDSGEFVINLAPARLTKAVDFCGVRSGRDIDKWKQMGLTASPSQKISAPLIEECPVNLECKVKDVIKLGTHDMFLAEILAVHVEESLIDFAGKLHLEKAGLIGFAHGEYYELGRRTGSFGFSVRKKAKPARAPSQGKKSPQDRRKRK